MTTTPLLTIDRRYDREYASDGVSRLGAYLTSRLHQLNGDRRIDPVEWAVWCWDCATSPVMSPAFAAVIHPGIQSVNAYRDYCDGRLAVRLDVIAPLPSIPGRWRTWEKDLSGAFEIPEARAGQPVALASVRLDVILDDVDVSAYSPNGGLTLLEAATRTVSEVVDAINEQCSEAVRSIFDAL